MPEDKNISGLLSGFLSETLTSKEKADLYQSVMDDSRRDEIMSWLQEQWTSQTADIKSDTTRITRTENQKWKLFFRYAAVFVIAFGLSWMISLFVTNKSNTSGVAVLSPPYNEIQLPNGSKTKITLPDSTIVWLNAGSKTEYPADFTAQRFVSLEGEAYFHVARRASVPFTVHTSEQNITVTGTIFNVNAYPDEVEVVTTLVEGKIALQFDSNPSSQIILRPNQQVIFNRNSKYIMLATVEPEVFISWVEGYFKFENVSFERIARHFERSYDISIRFEKEALKANRFTGTFLQNQSIESILELLREIGDFNYTIQENQITIYFYFNRLNKHAIREQFQKSGWYTP